MYGAHFMDTEKLVMHSCCGVLIVGTVVLTLL